MALFTMVMYPSRKYTSRLGEIIGGSFELSFQVANVSNPNSVVFSVMEAKDYKSNLRLCLESYQRQNDQFEKVTWHSRKFVIFFFGDYDIL